MATESEYIILVHGTGATAPDHRGEAWWQDQSPLWLALTQTVKASGGRQQIEAFIWSGANSESERRKAGRDLCKRLIAIDGEGAGVHLIGHSHGGSVIWNALQDFELRGGRIDRTVRSWASVGAPFLKYGIRRARLWLALISIALATSYLSVVLFSLRGVEWTYAWRDENLSTLAWIALMAIPILTLAWGVKAALPFVLMWLRRRRRTTALTGSAAAARYLALWSTQDEPIIGLGASGSFSLKVLQESGSSAKYTEMGKQRSRLRHLVAAAVNQFVNNLVSRAVQGSTVSHLELRTTDHYPHEGLAHRPLPSDIDHALIFSANENSSILGRRVRDLLVSGRNPLTGFADLQTAAAKVLTFKELVHTSYFVNPACIALLLHHVECHATLEQAQTLPEPLLHFYRSRQDLAPQYTLAKPSVLPSNRMGFAIMLASLGVLTLSALAFISQSVLHQKALAPTTARHHLRAAISPSLLGEVMSTSVPAEELEYQLSTSGRDIPWYQNRGDVGDEKLPDGVATELTAAMEYSPPRLRSYLQGVLKSGEQAALIAAAQGLETPELRKYFYSRAWPLLLQTATDAQLAELLTPSPLFPGPRRHHGEEVGLSTPDGYYFPAVETAIEKLAARNKLDRAEVTKLQALCADSAYCQKRIQMTAAQALVTSNAKADPTWLLPLPVNVGITYVSRDGEQTPVSVDVLIGLHLRDNTEGRFLKWASTNGEWQHVAFFSRSPYPHPTLVWRDFEVAVEKALASAEGVTINYVLAFLMGQKWDIPLPETVLGKIKSGAVRQFQPPARPTVPAGDRAGELVTDRAIEKFLKMERNKAACAKWSMTVPTLNNDADIDEKIAYQETMPPGVKCPESRTARDGQRQLTRMKKAAQAEQFSAEPSSGEDSLMANFPQNRIPSADQAAWSELFMHGLKRAACDALTDGFYYSNLMPDEERLLAGAFTALGPAPANLPAWITQWIDSVENPATMCGIKGPLDRDRQRKFIERAGLFTFYLANWLHSTHREIGWKLMQRLSGRIESPFGQRDLIYWHAYEETVARWMQKNTYAVDALYASRGRPKSFRLIRRAAYYYIAACEQSRGREDRARRVAQLARQSGYAARTFGRPSDLVDVLKAEARYHATRKDWRSASNVCARCDSSARLVVTVALIPELAAAANGTELPEFECDNLNDVEFEQLIATQQAFDNPQAAAVEQAGR